MFNKKDICNFQLVLRNWLSICVGWTIFRTLTGISNSFKKAKKKKKTGAHIEAWIIIIVHELYKLFFSLNQWSFIIDEKRIVIFDNINITQVERKRKNKIRIHIIAEIIHHQSGCIDFSLLVHVYYCVNWQQFPCLIIDIIKNSWRRVCVVDNLISNYCVLTVWGDYVQRNSGLFGPHHWIKIVVRGM